MINTLSKEKTIVAKIFGLHSHIVELERRIHDLSWDKTFNMWARNAFLQFCRVMPRGRRTVVFIDIDDVHGLNARFGYQEVDRKIRNMFAIQWRSGDVVARWYSGDEMVILFDNHQGVEKKMGELLESAQNNGLGFVYGIGSWNVGKESIESVIGRISDRLRERHPESKR